MALNLDVSKLTQAAAANAKPHDNLVVLDLGTGTFPRDIEVRLPDDDGARQNALWDGSLNLSVNDEVLCFEYSGLSAWRVMAMGGNDGGQGKVRVSEVWESDFGAVALEIDATGNAEFKQNILLTRGGGGSVGPQMNLESPSAGAVDSEFAFFGAGAGSSTDSQGPNFGMRGNNFTRAANQRGRLFFNAGDVSTPIGDDAAITFTAYNFHKFLIDTTEMMEIISTGIGINTTPNAAVKLQVKLATNQNIILSDASGESRFSAINDAFGAFVSLGIVGDPIIFRGAAAAEIARLDTSAFDLATAYIEVDEISAPGGGAANTCRIYAEDNGAGKTRLMAIFNTGAAQQIAIEP